jgi:Tfp pilus assembly protein PilO
MIYASFSKREKNIFIIAIIFIAAALSCNFIFKPCIEKWQSLNKEILIKKARISKDIRLIERGDTIIREYNIYTKPAQNITMILNNVENQADSLGIKTSNIKPGQAIERSFYKEYNIELQIEGEMKDIVKFLSALIKTPTLAALKKFDFKLISQGPPIFKGTIVLSKIII